MKKNFVYSISALLSVVSLLVGLNTGLSNSNYINTIIIGVVVMLITIVIFQMGKTTKQLYYLTTITNSFATGMIMSVYYTYLNVSPNMESMMIIGLVVFIVISLVGSISLSKNVYKNRKLYTALFLVFIYVLLATIWIIKQDVLSSEIFFISQIGIFAIVSFLFLEEEEQALRKYALSTFGMFAVVLFVVLLVVSEGEILDVSGVAVGDSKKQKKTLE